MPLRHIKEVLDLTAPEAERVTRAEAAERHGVPENVLARLEELDVLGAGGYDADDERIVQAIARFRAGGYDESLGFTVYDTLRYRDALAPLVGEEVRVLLDRLAGEVSVERAVEIIASGAEPLRELIGAMHSRMLREELRRRREEA
jgi:hypothetical protein